MQVRIPVTRSQPWISLISRDEVAGSYRQAPPHPAPAPHLCPACRIPVRTRLAARPVPSKAGAGLSLLCLP